MHIDDDIQRMASTYYGYGCWEAPHWFLGPEEGMAAKENDDLSLRVEAWRHFGRQELNDCPKFHLHIGEKKFHGEHAVLQATWSKLLLKLADFFWEADSDCMPARVPKIKWGCQPGETCVIELSGLAANNLNVTRDRDSFLDNRIVHIRDRMREHKPKFTVLYGKTTGCEKAWDVLTRGGKEVQLKTFTFAKFRRCGPTIVAWTKHPVSFGSTNEVWSKLGSCLLELVELQGARASG